MKLVFYTATCFMDISLEVIKVLKEIVDLHVIIEITDNSKNQNIADVERLPDNESFVDPEHLLTTTSYEYMKPYIEGAASVKFLTFSNETVINSVKRWYKIYNYIRAIKPDAIHVEALLIRSFLLLPSLLSIKKIFLSIHDPVQHLGEKEFKLNLLKNIFLKSRNLKGIFFYSEFAKNQFEQHYPGNRSPKWAVRMNPFTYFKNFSSDKAAERKNILFFGRISPYKGIDVLADAMPSVFKSNPDEHLIIAGRCVNNYEISGKFLSTFPANVTIMNRHISNSELVTLIEEARFVVCPYIEATQSGVLMTSFALNTPVIASAVGAFTEYVDENTNGALVPPGDAQALAEKIELFLNNNYYTTLIDKMKSQNEHSSWNINKSLFSEAYAK